jgi:hypothetical protein
MKNNKLNDKFDYFTFPKVNFPNVKRRTYILLSNSVILLVLPNAPRNLFPKY